MTGPLVDWYTGWGDAVIVWMQTFRSPILDEMVHGFQLLGDNRLLLAVIAVLFWTFSKRLAVSVAFLLSFSGYLNTLVKTASALPRPAGPGIVNLETNSTYSFPSGHAQSAASVWGRITLALGDGRLWLLFGVVVGLTSVARVYRAAHYPGDVIVGILLGLAALVIFLRLQAWLEPRVLRWPLAAQVGVPVVLGVVLFLPMPGSSSATATGGFIGIAAGAALENRFVRMRTSGASLRQYASRVVLGAAGMAVILAVDNVFPGLQGARFQTAVATGLWITCLAPALFCALGLAGRNMSGPAEGALHRQAPPSTHTSQPVN